MKIEVKGENYNRLLRRKELQVFIDHTAESTPAMAAVQQLLAAESGSEVDRTEIRDIITSKGLSTSVCRAFIWDDKTVKDLSKKEEKEAAA